MDNVEYEELLPLVEA